MNGNENYSALLPFAHLLLREDAAQVEIQRCQIS